MPDKQVEPFLEPPTSRTAMAMAVFFMFSPPNSVFAAMLSGCAIRMC